MHSDKVTFIVIEQCVSEINVWMVTICLSWIMIIKAEFDQMCSNLSITLIRLLNRTFMYVGTNLLQRSYRLRVTFNQMLSMQVHVNTIIILSLASSVCWSQSVAINTYIKHFIAIYATLYLWDCNTILAKKTIKSKW